MTRLRNILKASVTALLLFSGVASAQNAPNATISQVRRDSIRARLFRNSMGTRSRCCIPKYDYGHDDQTSSTRVVAQVKPVDESQIAWFGASRLDSAGTESPQNTRTITRKRFHVPASTLVVDHIQLDQVGLILYQTGQLSASGFVSHSGGPYGDLLGNRVTITLRAFAGQDSNDVPLVDSPVIWESRQHFWARRGKRNAVRFAPTTSLPTLRQRYHEITHIELELEYSKDR